MQLNRRNTVLLVAAVAGATTLITPMLAAGAPSALPSDMTTAPVPSASVVNPTITAQVTSADPESADGWYRGQADISFTCAAGSAPLASDCPTPVSLTKVGRDQSVTETIADTDGGTASVTVTENIDLGAPTITNVEPRRGICQAHDPVSGLQSCKVHKTRATRNGVTRVSWIAVATDNAGNVYKKYGVYKV
jgi:hypothetical protein